MHVMYSIAKQPQWEMGASKLNDLPISAYQKKIVSSSNRFNIPQEYWEHANFNHYFPEGLRTKYSLSSHYTMQTYQIITLCTFNTLNLYLALKYCEVKKIKIGAGRKIYQWLNYFPMSTKTWVWMPSTYLKTICGSLTLSSDDLVTHRGGLGICGDRHSPEAH